MRRLDAGSPHDRGRVAAWPGFDPKHLVADAHKPLTVRYPTTPDGRYFVVRGRLWRCANPTLDPAARAGLQRELMAARRAKGVALRKADLAAQEVARARVDAAKRALGERGPPWWTDGAPDLNRHMARNTPYADWFAGLPSPS